MENTDGIKILKGLTGNFSMLFESGFGGGSRYRCVHSGDDRCVDDNINE